MSDPFEKDVTEVTDDMLVETKDTEDSCVTSAVAVYEDGEEMVVTDIFDELSNKALGTYKAHHPQRLRPVNIPPPDLERRKATEELRKKREEQKRNAEKSE